MEQPISQKYHDLIVQMVQKSRGEMVITQDNVYQSGNNNILPFIDKMVEDHLTPESMVRSFANMEKLSKLAAEGKSCLLLVEHYSNFDLPVLHYLLRKADKNSGIAEKIIAIAGYKLNETNPVVTAFTEAYSRLVIYPSRSIEAKKASGAPADVIAAETAKSNAINLASMKKLNELKVQDKIILVFPSGTRYRPWDPSSKKGVREIDSYIRSFDYMCLVSINGGILFISQDREMHEDNIGTGTMVFDVSEPVSCEDFREQVKNNLSEGQDRKQAIVDEVMERLQSMHDSIKPEVPDCF